MTDRTDLFFASLFAGAGILLLQLLTDGLVVPWLHTSGIAAVVQRATLTLLAG